MVVYGWRDKMTKISVSRNGTKHRDNRDKMPGHACPEAGQSGGIYIYDISPLSRWQRERDI